jgi:hypothetical protein
MTLMKLMLMALIVGIVTGGYGLYLLFFTSYVSDGGLYEIFFVVGLITLGVFLLVPAKIYIIIQLTTREQNSWKNKQ